MKARVCDICGGKIKEIFVCKNDDMQYEYDIIDKEGKEFTIFIAFDNEDIDICHKCISEHLGNIS